MAKVCTVRVEGMVDQYLMDLPDKCPFCHHSIIPEVLAGHKGDDIKLQVFMSCPNNSCGQTFIGYYYHKGNQWYYHESSRGQIITREFSDTIQDISPSFVTIFNQAYFAEQEKHIEICGMGYRKALEFLIKDYLIMKKPADKEKIESKFLGKCIDEYIDDTRIKSVSKRAAWLGNDETHYIRKWEGKDFNDLKTLIELTIHWIEAEHLTKAFEDAMPE